MPNPSVFAEEYGLGHQQETHTYLIASTISTNDPSLGNARYAQIKLAMYRTEKVTSLIGCANAAYIPYLKEGVLRRFG